MTALLGSLCCKERREGARWMLALGAVPGCPGRVTVDVRAWSHQVGPVLGGQGLCGSIFSLSRAAEPGTEGSHGMQCPKPFPAPASPFREKSREGRRWRAPGHGTLCPPICPTDGQSAGESRGPKTEHRSPAGTGEACCCQAHAVERPWPSQGLGKVPPFSDGVRSLPAQEHHGAQVGRG